MTGAPKHLLAKDGRLALEALRGVKVLWAFDFDGTLSPLVPKPEDAAIAATTRALLKTLAEQAMVAAISGRERADLAARLEGTGITKLIGNHGAEGTGRPLVGLKATVRKWREELEPLLPEGVLLEDKHSSLSLHAEVLPRSLRLRVEALEGARIVEGKKVLNVVHQLAPDKGDALVFLAQRHEAEQVLYVGDDVTDEHAFRVARAKGWLSVHVGGRSQHTLAEWWAAPTEIDALLELLVQVTAKNGAPVTAANF